MSNSTTLTKLIIYTDGGSRGNPGQAACAFVVQAEDGSVIHEHATHLGVMTNNEAEYHGVLTAATWLSQQARTFSTILWRLDSKLVVEQMSGRWKIKEERMRALAGECHRVLDSLSATSRFEYVPRAQNARADALLNACMDRVGE